MLNPLLQHGWPLLVSVTVKSLFLLGTVGFSALCLRRTSAAARHLVWRLGLVGLLLLPALSLLPAVWQMPLWTQSNLLPAPSRLSHTSLSPSLPVSGRVARDEPGEVPSETPPALATGQQTPSFVTANPSASQPLPWPAWAFLLWAGGAFLCLVPLLAGLIAVRQVARRSLPLTEGPLVALAASLVTTLSVTRSVRLMLGAVSTPMTWGWRRPVILLPTDADHWSDDRLQAVLLHELSHIARSDWPVQMASQTACALYWYNPLVWLAARQARIESERACDDRVLLAGVSAPDYARHLLEVARSLRSLPLMSVLPMASASTIENRLRCILSKKRKRDMLSKKSILISSAIALLILLPLAGLKLVARAAARPPKTTTAAKGIDPKAVALVTQMDHTYRALKSYSGVEVDTGSRMTYMPYRMELTYQRPRHYVVEIKNPYIPPSKMHTAFHFIDLHLMINQKGYYATDQSLPLHIRHYTLPAKSTINVDDQVISSEGLIPSPIIPMLLQPDKNSIDEFTQPWPHETMSVGAPSVVRGIPVETVIIRSVDKSGSLYTTVLKIGQSDHLLRQISYNTASPNQPPDHTTQTFLYVAANPVLPASTFVFKAPPGAVVVDEKPAGADADPKAVALIRQMYAADAALKSYSCHIIETQHGPSYGQNGMTIQTIPVSQESIEVRKPYEANITFASQCGVDHAVSDGTTLYVTTTEHENNTNPQSIQALPMRYLKMSLKDDWANIGNDLSSFDRLPAIGGYGDQMFMPEDILGWVNMPADGYNWKMGAPAIVDGAPVDTVTLRENDLNDANYSIISLAISRKDHLLRQVIDAFHQAKQPVQDDISTFRDIKINPTLPKSTFIFTPAPGSQPVSQVTALLVSPW